MIRNPSRLYDHQPADNERARHSLRLIDHFLLRPLGEAWDITITSAYRTPAAQAALTVAAKAKGVSQHTLGEAVDVVPTGDMKACYVWCIEHLRPWQALLEYAAGVPSCIHLSIPSSIETIVSKRLIFSGGVWQPYTGTFQVVA